MVTKQIRAYGRNLSSMSETIIFTQTCEVWFVQLLAYVSVCVMVRACGCVCACGCGCVCGGGASSHHADMVFQAILVHPSVEFKGLEVGCRWYGVWM